MISDLLFLFVSQGYIDASEEGFDATVALGNEMVENEHPAKDDVAEKVENMEAKKLEVAEMWEKKKVEYDQRMEFQTFNRDIEQMEAVMAKQEVNFHLNFLLGTHCWETSTPTVFCSG